MSILVHLYIKTFNFTMAYKSQNRENKGISKIMGFTVSGKCNSEKVLLFRKYIFLQVLLLPFKGSTGLKERVLHCMFLKREVLLFA